MDATTTPEELATAYFDAWRANDTEAYRAILSDDATFDGPLGTARSGDECAEGIKGLFGITERVEVERRWVDGDDVITWFRLKTKVAEPTLDVVNWSHVTDGKIDRIQVTFDPRPLLDA